MDGIYGWIRNLTGFFLFMSVIENLLPNKKYGKYVRLFSGMILILLVLQPLTGSLRLEDKIAHYYESFVFRYQADDLQSEILGIEKQRLEQMIGQYEHAVELDVGQMAEDMGFFVRECSVSINGEEDTEQFGTVTSISLRIAAGESGEAGTGEIGEAGREAGSTGGMAGVRNDQGQQPIDPVEKRTIAEVEPVVIGDGKDVADGGSRQADVPDQQMDQRQSERGQQNQAGNDYRKSSKQLDPEVGRLRRKIASYYSLEEAYVEIQIVEG